MSEQTTPPYVQKWLDAGGPVTLCNFETCPGCHQLVGVRGRGSRTEFKGHVGDLARVFKAPAAEACWRVHGSAPQTSRKNRK